VHSFVPLSAHRNLWHAFLDAAAANPDGEAFVGPQAAVDYRTLAGDATRLAGRLRFRGIGRGDRVAIEMPVGVDFVTGVLAVLATGAAYVPIDVTTPGNRRERILEDARPALVLREIDAVPDGSPISSDLPGVVGDDPAYVIYTSGSTGVPKGVVVPARGIGNLLAAFQARAPLAPGARYSWWTSPGFDVSVYEMWSALTDGGTVVPVPEDIRRDAEAVLNYLARQRIDSAYLPAQILASYGDRLQGGLPAPRLRRLLTGVEPIPLGHLVALRRLVPDMVVINGYGPTETTVCATLYTVPDAASDPQQRTPIGRVIEGNRGFVVDEHLVPVAPGCPGELCIAGTQVALGYLHDPERTAERFVPALDGDGLMYRTGDLVVADASGDFTFLGRLDDQIKVDGVRIEPAETEMVMRHQPEVADVAVLPWPAGRGAPAVLTAFVVPTPAAQRPGDPWRDLRARLADELPAQAVPRRFVKLARIPMTSDGKLDRGALPRPAQSATRPPRTPFEQAVLRACRTVLPAVPPDALAHAFTALGGESLRAARLATALQRDVGRAVTAGHVLSAPTLADLAADLTELAPANDASHTSKDQSGPVPLTAGQLGIWASEVAGRSPGAFHEGVALELTGMADATQLAGCLSTILNRRPILRARVDDRSMALTADTPPVVAHVWEPEPGETAEDAWQRMLLALHHPRFNLDSGPLVRAAVLRAGLDAVRLLLVWHHLVVDAWSVQVLLADLAAALAGSMPPDGLDTGYAGYARQQRDFLDSPDGRRAVQEAADRVHAWLPPRPTDVRPAAATSQVVEFAVGAKRWRAVRACARRTATTTFAVTLAALLRPLCELADTGGRFALAVADRDEAADTDVVGHLLTTVPFGPRQDTEQRAADAGADLQQATDTIRAGQAMARVPFPSLMAALRLRDPQMIAPLVLAWDHDPAVTLSIPGYTARTIPVRPLGTRWPWTVVFYDGDERGLSGRIEFPRDVRVDQVQRFVASIEPLLAAFVDAVDGERQP
jgi:amino acid adenylation domain-containing protein